MNLEQITLLAIRAKLLTVLVFLALFVSSCATVETNQTSQQLSSSEKQVSYNLFFTPADNIEKLLKSKQYKKASAVYNAETEYFSKTNKKDQPLLNVLSSGFDALKKGKIPGVLKDGKIADANVAKQAMLDELAENLNNNYKPALNQHLQALLAAKQNPAAAINWPAYKKALNESFSLITDYTQNKLLRLEKYQLAEVDDMQGQRQALIDQFKNDAGKMFLAFEHSSEAAFFDDYPVRISDRTELINSVESELISSFDAYKVEELETFLSKYKQDLTAEEGSKAVYAALSDSYIKKVKGKYGDGLKGYFNSVTSAEKSGFELGTNTGIKVAIIDGSSQSLLTAGAIEFPVSLDIDFLANASKTTLQEALSGDYDYILVFSINVAKNTRRILKREKVSSEYVSGTRSEANPAYERARLALYQAQHEYNVQNSSYCSGLACIIQIALTSAASKNLKQRNKIFANTSATVKKDIHDNYEYSQSNVAAKKAAYVKYYFMDIAQKKLHTGDFDVLEEQDFSIAYNLKKKDTSRYTILKKNDKEEDISAFEDEGISVNLSDIVKQVLSGGGKVETLNKRYTYLKDKILADRHTTILKHNDDIFDEQLEEDKRMEHVVVVYNPTGSLGTGFYIKPDLILTNYHVIEGSKFVEIKTNSGMETFGKVVKSDVRLDLALIKVQQRGVPVKFHNGSINSGSTVEALGHPNGLEFSVTRGVVSAIRKRESVFDVGGKEVLFIQTDTPINHGNSGGPLFLGKKVVGVNSNKLVDLTTEGIGFSIHYKEVEKFLNKEF